MMGIGSLFRKIDGGESSHLEALVGDDRPESETDAAEAAEQHSGRKLTPAAKRALAEAEERRKARESQAGTSAKEVGGRDGPDPARYGDWEKDGILSDF